jgi:Uma2 family endonuclease
MGASIITLGVNMVQAPQSPKAQALLTLEAFLAMPETQPASEFIDGKIFPKPMPQGKHSAIQSEFVAVVNGQLKRPKVARSFAELRCTFGGRAIVPDVSVFVWERIVRDAASGEVANVFAIAPDWTIEILSPDQSQTKVVKNIVHCLKHGAQMGWLIDPDDRTVFVYEPDREIAIFDGMDDRLPMPGFAVGLALTVGELFGWLVD